MRLSFRSSIIIVFSVITLAVSGTLARVGYVTVREIYLAQLGDQVQILVRLCASETEPKYLAYAGREEATTMAEDFYQRQVRHQRDKFGVANVFIFREDYSIVASADSAMWRSDGPEPLLQLNRTEIAQVTLGSTVASLAFKGKDGQWYMWGFTRLDEQHWMGIQENADRLSRIDDLTWTIWSVMAIGLLLTAAGGWILAQRLAVPVEHLVRFSQQLGRGDLGTSAPKGVEGELGHLARAMDRMRQDLRRRHREREDMLAQIAHEIRNPLGGIELLAGLIREDVVRESRDTNYLDRILGEVARLKSLITAYLEYGRPVQARIQKISLQPVVSEVLSLIEKDLKDRCIEVSLESADALIEFDPNHLHQIVLNLINNSARAIGRNGRIRISIQDNGSHRFIRFSDNGPGIGADEIDRIFEPFYSTDLNGFGLGLAICQRLCEENRAAITCENNEDRGCTFSIRTALSP